MKNVVAPASGFMVSVSDTWTSGGPYGGEFEILAISPSHPDVIYAGTSGCVYKSTDAGATWSWKAYIDSLIVLQVAPDNANVIYAGTEDGVYKSADGGSTWMQKGLAGAQVNTIVIDPDTSSTLYVGTGTWRTDISAIFKSTNGGDKWDEILATEINDTSYIQSVETLLIDSETPQTIYAGITKGGYSTEDNGGLRKSSDDGKTWEIIEVNSDDEVFALTMTPKDHTPAAIYAQAGDSLFGDFYRSTDQGKTWDSLGKSGSAYRPIVVDPNTPTTIYAVGINGLIFKSTNSGDDWTEIASGVFSNTPQSWVIDPRNGKSYVAPRGDIYYSIDGGDHWVVSEIIATSIRDLAVDPTSSSTAFAAVDGSYYMTRTTGSGSSWEYMINSQTDLAAVSIDPNETSTIFAGKGLREGNIFSIYKSINSGQDWTPDTIMTCSPGTCYAGIGDILVSAANSDQILVGMTGSDGVLIWTTDGGDTWTWDDTWYMGSYTALAADPNDPSVVYVGSLKDINRYTDMWGDANGTYIGPSGGTGIIRDVEVDMDSRVYIAASDGLWRWDGSDWTHFTNLPTDDINAVAIDLTSSPNAVYLGTEDKGVYASLDSGGTWMAFNQGLEGLSIQALEVSTSQPKMLYAGLEYGGVWSIDVPSTSNGGSQLKIYLPSVMRNH